MEIITKSAKETQKLGQKLATSLKSLRPGGPQGPEGDGVIALYGELGSGKTTFVQGLARGLGIKRRIISPTFIFVRPYTLDPKPCTLYHVDLYRIDTLKQTTGLGLEEIFADKNAIVAIEWAEKIKKILPKKRIDIYFEYLSENKRRIKLLS